MVLIAAMPLKGMEKNYVFVICDMNAVKTIFCKQFSECTLMIQRVYSVT